MSELQYQFSTSTALASRAIRILTCSQFSHVDLVLPEGLLGASGSDRSINDPGGVIIRPNPAWPYLDPPKIARVVCTQEVAAGTIAFARLQIGKPFDNKALYAFLRDRAGVPRAGRDWRDPAAWFCSELHVRALEVGGLFHYQLIQPKDVISPQSLLLYLNPFMPAENIQEFL